MNSLYWCLDHITIMIFNYFSKHYENSTTILPRLDVLFHAILLVNHINSSFTIWDVNLSFIGVTNFKINNSKSPSLVFCPLQIPHVNRMSLGKKLKHIWFNSSMFVMFVDQEPSCFLSWVIIKNFDLCLDTPKVDKFIFDKIERKIKY